MGCLCYICMYIIKIFCLVFNIIFLDNRCSLAMWLCLTDIIFKFMMHEDSCLWQYYFSFFSFQILVMQMKRIPTWVSLLKWCQVPDQRLTVRSLCLLSVIQMEFKWGHVLYLLLTNYTVILHNLVFSWLWCMISSAFLFAGTSDSGKSWDLWLCECFEFQEFLFYYYS